MPRSGIAVRLEGSSQRAILARLLLS